MLDKKVRTKIERKIMGMGIYRVISGEKPRLLPSEFRFIIGCYGIKKTEWWDTLKEMESLGVLKLSGNKRFITILMDGNTVQKFVVNKKM